MGGDIVHLPKTHCPPPTVDTVTNMLNEPDFFQKKRRMGTIPLVVPHFLDTTKSILYAVTPSDF